MKPVTRLLYVITSTLVLAACASPPANPAPSPEPTTVVQAINPQSTAAPKPTIAAPGLLLSRPQGERGPLVAFDMATGSQRFTLPAGVLAANGQAYFAAGIDGADTLLGGYDLGSGAALDPIRLPGNWSLSAVSPTGRWTALTQIITAEEQKGWTAATEWHTPLQIVDTTGRLTPQSIDLPGNFAVDALSSRGDSLYVIEYLPAQKPDHYQVRLYDLAAHALVDGALVDKREPDEVMWGERWDALGSRDGRWQLTLYLRPDEGIAFIHALDLDNRYTLCYDLPGQSADLDSLKYYSLALAPGGHTLYAANPVLGKVARVDLDDFAVSTVATFEAVTPGVVPAITTSRGVMSRDGRAMYFTDGAQAWAFDTQKQTVSLLAQAAGGTGLDLSPDGTRLYLASQDQSLVMLDTASGQPLSFTAASAAGQ
ncbi:MAG: hypothetical protein ABI847_15510 [Anaerolineales bacterium]